MHQTSISDDNTDLKSFVASKQQDTELTLQTSNISGLQSVSKMLSKQSLGESQMGASRNTLKRGSMTMWDLRQSAMTVNLRRLSAIEESMEDSQY